MEIIYSLTIWVCTALSRCEPIEIDTGLSAVACSTMARDLDRAGPFLPLGDGRVAVIPRVGCAPTGIEIGV